MINLIWARKIIIKTVNCMRQTCITKITILTFTYERLTHAIYCFYNKCFYRRTSCCIFRWSFAGALLRNAYKTVRRFFLCLQKFILLWAQTLVGIANVNSYVKFQIKCKTVFEIETLLEVFIFHKRGIVSGRR